MTTVRSRVRDGFVEVSGPEVSAVVEAAERHTDALANAASEGLLQLLDLVCSRGLLVMPSFGIVSTAGGRVRVLLRGPVVLELADGRSLAAEDRQPWRDVDVEDPGDEVTLATPEPRPARGWRRPARLAAAADPSTAGDTQASAADPLRVASSRPEATGPAQDAEPEPATVPDPEPESEPDPEPAPVVPPADLTLPPPEDAPAGAAPADRVPPSPPPATGIIDAVPWRRPGGSTPPPPADPPRTERFDTPTPAAPPPAPVDEPDDPGDRLTPEPQDPEPPAPAAEPAPEPTSRPVAETPVADVTTSRGALPRSDEDLDRPVVLAVLCPAGHHSAPHAGRCRTCGREIPPQQPTPIPRPSLGVLRISTGGLVPLDRGVLLGRAPRVNEELPPSQRPHLVRVGGVDRDISRNHAEVVLEGWHVLVRDLGSTNGTTVALPGEEPVRLRPTEDQGIEPGSVITLADEVSLTYEVEE